MNKTPTNPIHPDAPRTALKGLVKMSKMSQKRIGEAVGVSETDFSKILSGTYKLETPLLVGVFNVLQAADGITWDDYSTLVESISRELSQ